ncbi:hypothetical protein LDENG_00114250 [Lucifuga dentata]|nr:hypothetical protein LDENG_00114250 [Lucifuga dentata]
MAAALLRGQTGLCMRCIHRELCRLVWRPQTALFSSKPSNRKEPRRTHIRKARPQPAVDVAKLLEQLFSQRRPSTASAATKDLNLTKAAQAAQTSTRPTTTSPKITSTPNISPPLKTKPALSVSPAAASQNQADDVATKTSSSSKTIPLSHPESVPPPSSSETATQFPPGFIQASTAGGVSNITHTSLQLEIPAVELQTTAETAEPKIENAAELAYAIESDVKASATTVEPSIEHSLEPLVDAKPSPLEAIESEAGVVEGSVEPVIEASADKAAQAESGGDFLHSATVEPIIDTATEPVEASGSVETPESRTSTAEGTLELTIEATADAVAETVSANSRELDADNFPHVALVENTQESGVVTMINKVESTVESRISSSGTVAVEEEINVAEAMTLESVTLAEVQALVESLKTDDLLQTKSTLDEKVETIFQDILIQKEGENKAAAETENVNEAETDSVTEVLSKRDSLSEDVEALKAETDILMEELLCSVPDLLSKAPVMVQHTSAANSAASSSNRESVQMEKEAAAEAEMMTLESVTLAEVKAGVGTLETEVLEEARTALEKEAEMTMKEQKMEVKTEVDDVMASEETIEAEILTLDSLTEAADTLEAETSLVLEAMFCSDQGPRDPDAFPDRMKLGPVDEAGLEAERGSRGQTESFMEAMTLESVTLAEVEASLEALETDSLSETTAHLEKEAEVLAGEKKTEVEDDAVSEEMKMNEALTIESLSLPEIDLLSEALQTEAMMEELLFSVPGHVSGVTEGLTDQEVVKDDGQDEEVVCEPLVGDEETFHMKSAQEETVVNEALTLESLTVSEVNALMETLDMEMFAETKTEMTAEEKEMEQDVLCEDAEEEGILTKVEVLAEAVVTLEEESTLVQQTLTCPVSGFVTTATVTTGSAGTETDGLPASPAVKDKLLGQEEGEAQSETLGTPECTATQTDLDPVQRLFLEKIREYNNERRLCGASLEVEPDYERRLSEEVAKLQRLYGGGDLSTFPQFIFTEPKLDSK